MNSTLKVNELISIYGKKDSLRIFQLLNRVCNDHEGQRCFKYCACREKFLLKRMARKRKKEVVLQRKLFVVTALKQCILAAQEREKRIVMELTQNVFVIHQTRIINCNFPINKNYLGIKNRKKKTA